MRASLLLVPLVLVALSCSSSSLPENPARVSNWGNPNGYCHAGVPTSGQAASVSSPTTVVGTGSAASCTFGALKAAVSNAGVITFNCGSDLVTIPVTATMTLSTTKDTVIDGGDIVTLDGGHAVQIFNYNSANFQA